MSLLQQLIECENSYPAAFAAVSERPYGKLFYNPDNPQSHDSNHALILDLDCDLEAAVEDLIMFYRINSLIPRVYSSFREEERERLIPVLSRRGFELKTSGDRIYYRQHPSRIEPRPDFRVRRALQLDPEISAIIRSEDDGDWNVIAIGHLLAAESFHLMVGYAGAVPVCLATLNLLNGLTRLDDVVTHQEHRGKGYGRALVHLIVDYHRRLSQNGLYLWASNPTAVRIYREAGFAELETQLDYWTAWYAPVSRH
jgi:ribosomal protein S18 acetylase RimI-like enzyme